jgi:hypothetical protein
VIVELVVRAALLAGDLCVSWYGWVTLPGDAPVPVHFGPAAYNNFVSKRVGLIMHPSVAVVLLGVLLAVGKSGVLPVIMGVLLITQAGAIKVARKRFLPLSGSDRMPVCGRSELLTG